MTELQEVENAMLQHRDPIVNAPELAEEIGRSDTHVRDKLEKLEYLDRVERKDVGARATAWYHVERVNPPRRLGDGEPRGQSSLARDAAGDAHGDESAGGPQAVESRPDAEQDPFMLAEWPSNRSPGECRQAVYAARDYIEDQGSATMRELVAEILPEHPVGYDVVELEEGDRYRGAWWRKVVKPGLEALPEIEKPATGGSEWTWRESA